MKTYYDRRAAEYDETTYEALDAAQRHDLRQLEEALARFEPPRVLDVACGTGYLTRLFSGDVTGVDQSEAMLSRARKRLPGATFVRADVPPLPFPDRSFDLALIAHFYGHLETPAERTLLIDEALRVAGALVVVEQAWQPGLPSETWQERELQDGSRHRVFKRYFTAEGLAAEIGADVLVDTPTFLAVKRDAGGRGA